MAAKKSTRSASTKVTKTGKTKIEFHKPGEAPQQLSLKAGTTFAEFVETYTLTGYDVFVNGDKVSGNPVLKTGDTVRIGLKTKNA
jgi:hypothetical protein